MGAQVCHQGHNSNGEIEEGQYDTTAQFHNITFDQQQLSNCERSYVKHPSLMKKNIVQVNCVDVIDDPVNISKDQESIVDRKYEREPETPELQINKDQRESGFLKSQMQNCQLLGGEPQTSVCINPEHKLIISQQEEVLKNIGEQQSVYSKSYKDDKKQKLLNMNLVEDNLDDYINYDWKNTSFQLISLQDQNFLKKVAPKQQIKFQRKF